ncbi:hypothetical protein APHAL10511_003874 [Amanita phalloides]|nr:hypothetical protein APHAL10511_003874 [Amanita phalloides]
MFLNVLPGLPLPQNLLDEFKNDMILLSHSIGAESGKEELRRVLISILPNLWRVVSSITLRHNIIDLSSLVEVVQSLNDNEIEEWKTAVQNGDLERLITHPKLQKPVKSLDEQAEQLRNILSNDEILGKAYTQVFVGDFATKFIEHLKQADEKQLSNDERPLYAKAISIVQSSGTGKSRMLTEVGKHIFTLPICLRKSTDLGYPRGDKPVVKFFSALPKLNDLSLTAHTAIACFIAVAHQTMLETLQKARDEERLDGVQLLEYWHGLMESTKRDGREVFFTEVVKKANTMKAKMGTF